MALKRSSPRGVAGSPADAADPVAVARTRARRRLIGAVVLLGIGIIAFPLVFETQPRPVPVDIAIEIPRKDAVPPLQMPASAPAKSEALAPAPPPASSPPVAAEPAPAPRAEAVPQPEAPPAPVAKPAPPPAKAAVAEAPKPAAKDDASRARALLEGKAPAVASGARFVVQVGAFADASAARETRLKVEKLGLKTYTQVAETSSGNRTRVRIGPFASREEAERVLGRTKAAGIDGVVLTL
jgi:DedD protein